MSVLVVGISHRTATLDLLERYAVGPADAAKLAASVFETRDVREVVVLATCNRVEVYAEVERFHGSVEDITALLSAQAGNSVDELVPAVYVRYDAAAVAHLFAVAAGLDSMVVGESQILGQVRESLRRGQSDDTVGPVLNAVLQQALRVGKRAHAETGIDKAGRSIISVAIRAASEVIGPIGGGRVLVVGAGSIASLAASTAQRLGVEEIVIASRTLANAVRLAAVVAGRAVELAALSDEMARADLVICCTGATGAVVPEPVVEQALRRREAGRRPLVIADLALPHDVEASVRQLDGVTVVDLTTVAARGHEDAQGADVAAVRDIVAEEVVAFEAARDAGRAAPTVVALRSMATAVLAAELERLWGRLDDLTPQQQAEISQTVRRVVDKLLHEPTVRMKELAHRSPDSTYADALAELFSLDQAAVEAMTRAGDLS